MTPRPLVALVAVSLLASCGSAPAAPGVNETPSGDFVSDGLPGPFDEGDVLRVTFREGDISFQATCNSMFGSADLEDDVLVVSSVGGTEMGCPGAGHEQDEWLVDFFTSSPALTVDGSHVRLATDDAEISLVPADEADPGPGTALVGTRWRLTGVEETDGDSVGMIVVPRRLGAGLEIDGDRIAFETGCNDAGGGVEVQGDRLRLREVAITLKGCTGIRREIESAQVPLVMAKRLRWAITGEQLRLTRGDTSLLYSPDSRR